MEGTDLTPWLTSLSTVDDILQVHSAFRIMSTGDCSMLACLLNAALDAASREEWSTALAAATVLKDWSSHKLADGDSPQAQLLLSALPSVARACMHPVTSQPTSTAKQLCLAYIAVIGVSCGSETDTGGVLIEYCLEALSSGIPANAAGVPLCMLNEYCKSKLRYCNSPLVVIPDASCLESRSLAASPVLKRHAGAVCKLVCTALDNRNTEFAFDQLMRIMYSFCVHGSGPVHHRDEFSAAAVSLVARVWSDSPPHAAIALLWALLRQGMVHRSDSRVHALVQSVDSGLLQECDGETLVYLSEIIECPGPPPSRAPQDATTQDLLWTVRNACDPTSELAHSDNYRLQILALPQRIEALEPHQYWIVQTIAADLRRIMEAHNCEPGLWASMLPGVCGVASGLIARRLKEFKPRCWRMRVTSRVVARAFCLVALCRRQADEWREALPDADLVVPFVVSSLDGCDVSLSLRRWNELCMLVGHLLRNDQPLLALDVSVAMVRNVLSACSEHHLDMLLSPWMDLMECGKYVASRTASVPLFRHATAFETTCGTIALLSTVWYDERPRKFPLYTAMCAKFDLRKFFYQQVWPNLNVTLCMAPRQEYRALLTATVSSFADTEGMLCQLFGSPE